MLPAGPLYCQQKAPLMILWAWLPGPPLLCQGCAQSRCYVALYPGGKKNLPALRSCELSDGWQLLWPQFQWFLTVLDWVVHKSHLGHPHIILLMTTLMFRPLKLWRLFPSPKPQSVLRTPTRWLKRLVHTSQLIVWTDLYPTKIQTLKPWSPVWLYLEMRSWRIHLSSKRPRFSPLSQEGPQKSSLQKLFTHFSSHFLLLTTSWNY